MISTFLLREVVLAKERFGHGVPEVVFLLFPIMVLVILQTTCEILQTTPSILQIKPEFRKQQGVFHKQTSFHPFWLLSRLFFNFRTDCRPIGYSSNTAISCWITVFSHGVYS